MHKATAVERSENQLVVEIMKMEEGYKEKERRKKGERKEKEWKGTTMFFCGAKAVGRVRIRELGGKYDTRGFECNIGRHGTV